MNQPDRYEKFVLLPDQKKVIIHDDTKIKNAATFVIEKEDHTIGNLVRYQLFRDKNVTFSGYRVPHPLEFRMVVRCQTNGVVDPRNAMSTALEDLHAEFSTIKSAFQREVESMKPAGNYPPDTPYRY